jgi:hypothetical protein
LPTTQGVRLHQRQNNTCSEACHKRLAKETSDLVTGSVAETNDAPAEDMMSTAGNKTDEQPCSGGLLPPDPPSLAHNEATTPIDDSGGLHGEEAEGLGSPRCTWFEEVEDEDHYPQEFPVEHAAGVPSCRGAFKMVFEEMAEQAMEEGKVWGPFESEDEWELAQWLFENVGHGKMDEFLKLNFVSGTFFRACPLPFYCSPLSEFRL